MDKKEYMKVRDDEFEKFMKDFHRQDILLDKDEKGLYIGATASYEHIIWCASWNSAKPFLKILLDK